MGGVQEVVATLEVGLAPELLDQQSHAGTARVPEHEASAGFILDREQVEILADAAVVAPQGLLFAAFVFGQLLRCFPGGSIDALQLSSGLVASPVGAGNTFELKGLGVQLPCVLDMGTGAEIPPLIAQGVKGDRFLQTAQDLELVGLVLSPDFRFGLFAADFDALEGQSAADDLAHLLLDGLEIGFREGLRVVEVVIETRFGPGADGHLRGREELLHRHGHHMAHRVADLQQLLVFAGLGQNHRSCVGWGGCCSAAHRFLVRARHPMGESRFNL